MSSDAGALCYSDRNTVAVWQVLYDSFFWISIAIPFKKIK